jgi:hypothetical protein
VVFVLVWSTVFTDRACCINTRVEQHLNAYITHYYSSHIMFARCAVCICVLMHQSRVLTQHARLVNHLDHVITVSNHGWYGKCTPGGKGEVPKWPLGGV